MHVHPPRTRDPLKEKPRTTSYLLVGVAFAFDEEGGAAAGGRRGGWRRGAGAAGVAVAVGTRWNKIIICCCYMGKVLFFFC